MRKEEINHILLLKESKHGFRTYQKKNLSSSGETFMT